MKLTKPLFAAPPGEIYPREIPAGEQCPAALEQAAREAGALDEGRRTRKTADK
ncbi:hypothetical protein [Rhodovulum sp. MB263]|uniref:hypothetical protein n=1 Tax=Rhodovulum sp. (strain MB263) TaxID=308754 RepID=UPI0018C885B3|nr:hypothetical protein [Rhodovulum sp. MB263]